MTTATATSTNQDKALREQLVKLLSDSEAHANFETAVKDLPADLQGKRPKGAAHSPWEMLEHLAHRAVGHSRIRAQRQTQIA